MAAQHLGSTVRAIGFIGIVVMSMVAGCLGTGDGADDVVQVPFPRAGAWATYRFEDGPLEGHTTRTEFLGMADVPARDGRSYPAIITGSPHISSCASFEGWASEYLQITEIDPSLRMARSGWGRSMGGQCGDGGGEWFDARNLGLTRGLTPVNHLTGKTLAKDSAAVSFGFFGWILNEATGAPIHSSAGEIELTYTIESIRERQGGTEAVVRTEITGGDLKEPIIEWAGYRDTVPFPIWIGGSEAAPQRVLSGWAPGGAALDWDRGSPLDAAPRTDLARHPLGAGAPKATGVFEYGLEEALAEVEADATLVGFQAWRASDPDGFLRAATLRPYEDLLGRMGYEWVLQFDDNVLVRSLRVVAPSELAGVQNREPVGWNLPATAMSGPPPPSETVDLRDVLTGLFSEQDTPAIDWAEWSREKGCWAFSWRPNGDTLDWPLSRIGLQIDAGTGELLALLDLESFEDPETRDTVWVMSHTTGVYSGTSACATSTPEEQ